MGTLFKSRTVLGALLLALSRLVIGPVDPSTVLEVAGIITAAVGVRGAIAKTPPVVVIEKQTPPFVPRQDDAQVGIPWDGKI